jgi:hypothetical protein
MLRACLAASFYALICTYLSVVNRQRTFAKAANILWTNSLTHTCACPFRWPKISLPRLYLQYCMPISEASTKCKFLGSVILQENRRANTAVRCGTYSVRQMQQILAAIALVMLPIVMQEQSMPPRYGDKEILSMHKIYEPETVCPTTTGVYTANDE